MYLIYFNYAEYGLKEGLLVGITFIITGAILDSIITLPLFLADKSYLSHFFDKFMLLGFLEVIIIAMIAGYLFEKYSSSPKKGQARFLDIIRGAD